VCVTEKSIIHTLAQITANSFNRPFAIRTTVAAADQAAGGARVPAPRHDGRVREVGVEPAAAGGPVRRQAGEAAPVARRGGPDRAGQPVEVHQREAPVGRVPRAPHLRPPLSHRRRDGRRHRQVPSARRR
jgi:hypothetical protein